MAGFSEAVRGIADLQFAPLDAAGKPGMNTDYVGVKSFVIEGASETDEQMGDDQVLFTWSGDRSLDITTSAAMANLAVLGVVTGVAPITTGADGNKITTWDSPASLPTQFVQITGQSSARDTAGGAMRITVLKASLVSDPTWNLESGSWLEPEMSFKGVALGDSLLRVQSFQSAEQIPADGSETAGLLR
jgi:hypothetical protein